MQDESSKSHTTNVQMRIKEEEEEGFIIKVKRIQRMEHLEWVNVGVIKSGTKNFFFFLLLWTEVTYATLYYSILWNVPTSEGKGK